MPEKDYRCWCGEKLVKTASMDDESVVLCPKCGAVMKRVFTPVAVRPWGMKR